MSFGDDVTAGTSVHTSDREGKSLWTIVQPSKGEIKDSLNAQ
jgi:hypothetical protein